MKQFKLIIMRICSVSLLWLFFSGPAAAQTITEIIDATGDGPGNTLSRTSGITQTLVTLTSSTPFQVLPVGDGGIILNILNGRAIHLRCTGKERKHNNGLVVKLLDKPFTSPKFITHFSFTNNFERT